MTTIELSSPRAGVGVITLDRPDRLNAMNHGLVQDLHDAFDGLRSDRSTRVVVLTGAGRGFCAGLACAVAGRAPGTAGLGPVPAALQAFADRPASTTADDVAVDRGGPPCAYSIIVK